MDHVLGVDIGTQSTKALLVDGRGRVVAQHAKGYSPDTPRPMWAEQWPAVWLDAVAEAAARRAAATPPGARVGALCVSSLYGGSGIPLDAALEPLHPCLIWMDRRAEAEAERVRGAVDLDRLRAVTGNGVDSYYGFTKMLWLRDNRPEVWRRTRYLLPPNSYVAALLTGEVAVDHSSAGNIGGVYDMARRGWSREMLDALGIPAALMPERLVACSDVVGGLLPDWASRLGLPAGTPVVAGGVDAAVATFAAGATRAGQHVAMIGTSMCWGHIAPDVDARRGLVSMPNVVNGHRDAYVFGGAMAAGASVAWFRDQFCGAEAQAARQGGGDVLRELDAAARDVAEGAEGVVFLPYLMGERSPVWDGRASGAFVGLNLYHRRAHLYRAVLEGVGYALRHNMEAAGGAGALDERLVVVGGAARSDLWMQVIADITGLQVLTIEEDVEAALGAALLAALGTGMVTPEAAARGWVTLRRRAEPRPGPRAAYDRAFEVYRELYPALRGSMHALGRNADRRRALPR